MAGADAMVQAVVRADQQAVVEPAKAQAHADMRQAFNQARDDQDAEEVPGRNADQQRHEREPQIGQHIIQQMIAAIGPERQFCWLWCRACSTHHQLKRCCKRCCQYPARSRIAR